MACANPSSKNVGVLIKEKRYLLIAVSLLLLSTFAGCKGASEMGVEGTAKVPATPTFTSALTATPPPIAISIPATTAPPPEDVMSAWRSVVARLSPFHPEEMRLVSWERVEWPDDCLGIPMRDACTEAIVPGYRIVVECKGQEFEYRSTLLGAQPYRLLLASGPDHGIKEPALRWEGQEEDGCQSLLLASDGGAAIGPCDAPHEPSRPPDHSYRQYARLDLWDHWLHRFAPFQSETPNGYIIFRGQGTEEATPAWQRAMALWARMVRMELSMGRSGASWARALTWRWEMPEHPGYCHFLAVEGYGMAYASVAHCEGGGVQDLGRGWLETTEWEQFDDWLYGRSPLYLPDLQFFGLGSQEMSDNEVDALRRWTGILYDRLATPTLTVEEYPIVAQGIDTPAHLEYFQRIPAEVLEKRRAWREPTPESRVTSTNRLLIPFGYRLVPKEKPGWHYPFCDLYKNEALVKSDLDAVWPVSVNSAGDDFALLVEKLNDSTFLVRRATIEQWNSGRHCYIPPIFVGDDLVAIEVDEQHQQYAVRREGEPHYTFTWSGIPVPDPVKGLWSWMGHWVLEVDGQVIMDGRNLNEELGYDEIFGWRLLKGQPFYFFRKDNRIGVHYAGQVLPYQYDEVIHYRCCEPAAFNVLGNEMMVWFHARRSGMWCYVEMGVYGEDQE